jgi:SnoaL-like domain
LPRAPAAGTLAGVNVKRRFEMTDINTTIDAWFASLNELDGAKRAALVEQAWAGDGRWVDPPFEGEGHEAINQMVDAVYESYPDHRFRRVSEIDAHHDAVRYGWELVNRDGSIVLAGTDIGQVADDGRLSRITGFFGPPEPIT